MGFVGYQMKYIPSPVLRSHMDVHCTDSGLLDPDQKHGTIALREM
jgi:hypothetical protein